MKMILSKRSEYKSLKGWLGPRRFEDLPIQRLRTEHEDPMIRAGLKEIEALDDVLKEKTLEALLVDQETFPEKWAESEHRRIKIESEVLNRALR